jgi:hypothetical protein
LYPSSDDHLLAGSNFGEQGLLHFFHIAFDVGLTSEEGLAIGDFDLCRLNQRGGLWGWCGSIPKARLVWRARDGARRALNLPKNLL